MPTTSADERAHSGARDVVPGVAGAISGVGADRGLSRVLTAVALVLGVLVALQAVSLVGAWRPASALATQPFDVAEARAGMISQAGGHSILVSDAGGNALVVVLDNRTESLMVYRFEGNNSLQLFQKLSLPRLFTEARARGPGGR